MIINLHRAAESLDRGDRLIDAFEDGYATGKRHWFWRGVLRGAMVAFVLELLRFATLWWMGR